MLKLEAPVIMNVHFYSITLRNLPPESLRLHQEGCHPAYLSTKSIPIEICSLDGLIALTMKNIYVSPRFVLLIFVFVSPISSPHGKKHIGFFCEDIATSHFLVPETVFPWGLFFFSHCEQGWMSAYLCWQISLFNFTLVYE